MTYEEALNTLHDFIGCLVPARATILEYRRFEAFDKAIEALEKQIAQKPKFYEWDRETHSHTECCPTCGDTWNMNEFGEGIKYCWECGQRIDWSDAE